MIEKKLSETKKEYTLLIPYDKLALVNSIYGEYSVKSTEYTADGTVMVAVLDEKGKAVYGKFITD